MGISDDIRPVKKDSAKPAVDFLEPKTPTISVKKISSLGKISTPEREKLEEDFFGSFDKKNSHSQDFAAEKKRKKSWHPVIQHIFNKKAFALYSLAIIVIVTVVNIKEIKNIFNSSSKNIDTTAQYEGEIIPQDYTSSYTENESEVVETTEQPAQSAVEVVPPVIDKTSFEISVLNGNGIKGKAAAVKSILESEGFVVKKVSNANSFNYETTIIYYRSGFASQAELVSQSLSDRVVSVEESDSLTATYQIVVVVGKT